MELFQKHNGKYGYRRIYLALRNQGYLINHKKVTNHARTRIKMSKIHT
ncbi:IS3 family transposase [Mammaliicoccus sciuri]